MRGTVPNPIALSSPDRRRPLLPATLLLLTVFAPLSMDVYMPALPAIGVDLGASTSLVQLTVTACLIGLASGMLIGGPVSDRFGRRRVVLTGAGAYVVLSLLCAAAPTVETLIAARVAQGLAGGLAMIAGQAAGRDTYEGRALVAFFARIAMAAGTAAIIAPNLGAQLLRFVDWRGLFVTLAVIGGLVLAACAFALPETHPVESRTTGGLRITGSHLRVLMEDRVFTGAIALSSVFGAAFFAYLSAASFVLQEIYGLSPQQFALVMGINSAGFVGAAFFGGRVAVRWGLRAIALAIAAITLAGVVFATGGVLDAPLAVVLVAMFAVTTGSALAQPATSTLAVSGFPQFAGTANALVGVVRFGTGALAAPPRGPWRRHHDAAARHRDPGGRGWRHPRAAAGGPSTATDRRRRCGGSPGGRQAGLTVARRLPVPPPADAWFLGPYRRLYLWRQAPFFSSRVICSASREVSSPSRRAES